ncbi:MAG: hypothetical protein IT440_12690 [Phycisphaeraceae bacterium]|nr:hypothetical protein [Phycisphaeraceae bacterium]
MLNLPRSQVIERAVRQRICTQCFNRPEGSETLGPDEPRPCQPNCTIFINLPRLVDVTQRVHSPSMSPYERVVGNEICETTCEASATSGDYCGERTTRACPLSRYMREVLETIERVTA